MRARHAHAAFRDLPFEPQDPLLTQGRAMILAPHADDESLGCGGLIAELCERRRPPSVLIVTDGTGSHPNSRAWPAPKLRALREEEALRATGSLGLEASDIGFLRLRDTSAPREGAAFDEACSRIAEQATRQGCTTLLAPWLLDPHCDHEATQRMARRVASALGLRLLSYPVWGWLIDGESELPPGEPIRGFRLDISRHLPCKRRAIREHQSQYADLITDDPDGFRLPPALLAVFEQPFEVFLETP